MLALLVPVIMSLAGFSNPAGKDESAVKAMFIYNFSKYFDWTIMETKHEFVIGVCGNSRVIRYLQEFSDMKSVNGKPIVIKSINSISETEGIQMLFIPGNASGFIEIIRSSGSRGSMIIITESISAINKGAHINLLNLDGNLSFELNESQMKTDHIKCSHELVALAVKTY